MNDSYLKVVAAVALVGCADAETVETTEQALTAPQGDRHQGTRIDGVALHGAEIEGTRFDGADWQYTAVAPVTWGSTQVDDPEISRASLMFWRPKKLLGTIIGWERRGPNSICHYDADRNLDTCHTMGSFSAGSPSPIAGAKYQARFRGAGNALFDTTIQIGTSTTDHTAVAFDQSSAMHRLHGTNITSCSTQYSQGQTMADGTKCASPSGCHKNCDLWLYKIFLVDPAVNGGQPYAACGGNGYAIAVPGIYAADGTRTDGPMSAGKHTQFTFSCLSGTIAKCTQWGYRPWGSALKTCQTAPCGATPAAVPLVDLHQTCVRAAMADYCTNGTSYTREGTLVDIWDYEHRVAGKWGLVARTSAPKNPQFPSGAFVFESEFDKNGLFFMDHTRYAESVGESDGTGCNIIPKGDGWGRWNWPLEKASAIRIDSTTACAHAERTLGHRLHESCSACTKRIAATPGLEHCTSPAGWSPVDPEVDGIWDQACVERAQNYCLGWAWEEGDAEEDFITPMMTTRSECTTSSLPLDITDTGCTWRVCSVMPGCCSSSWSSTCVSRANQTCYGGREQGNTGFCGTPLPIGIPNPTNGQ